MTKWETRFNDYKERWAKKGVKAASRELETMKRYLSRHPDTFYHQPHPDELSDGDRVLALRDVISELGK